VGTSYRTVSMDDLAVLAGATTSIVDTLQASAFLQGNVTLSTCNRFEIYIDSDTFHGGIEATLKAVRAALPSGRADIVDRLDVYPDNAAVQHLLEVAAGLDSMVIGEAEIIGQVRDALGRSQASAPLHRLFSAALTTAKAVTTETALGAAGRSIASVGLDLVVQRHFPLTGRRAVVVGTGSFARVVTAALQNGGVKDIFVYSPSGRAEQFASTHPVTALGAAEFDPALADADLLIACSRRGIDEPPVLTATRLATVRANARARLPILDFSLPGDVEDAAADLDCVDLINLEEIRANITDDQADAVSAAQEIVNQGVETYLRLEYGRAASPAVVALRKYAKSFIDRETEAARKRYDEATTDAIGRSLHRVFNALLHEPSVRAADLARNGELGEYHHALHTLFGLDVEVTP